MRNSIALIIFWLFSSALAYAQRDTLYLDSLSGNYVIRYVARFTFVLDSAGRHAYDKDDPSDRGKKRVKFDSMVTVVFEPATKVKPKIKCTVTRIEGKLSFCYDYWIGNGIDSQQPLNELTVRFGKSVSIEDRTPQDGWHSMRGTDMAGSNIVAGNKWHWWGDIGLEPGRGWNVGRLASNGLPAIVPVMFSGKTKTLGFPDEGPGYDVTLQFLKIAGADVDCVHGWSLGPVAVPTPFSHEVFVDSLLSYRRRSSSLGWISNDSVAKSLDGKLRIVKRDVVEKKFAKAVVVVQALLRELEVHRSRSMTEDAYGLLRYNAEFLADLLAEAD
jgi:hypothetical protein